MAGKRKVTVEILGDASKLSGALKSSSRSVGKWGGPIAKGAMFAAAGLATGAAAAGVALVGMGKNAAADAQAQRRLAITLKNTAKATKGQIAQTEDWISKTASATGVTDDQLRPAMERLTRSTGDVGKAQRDMNLALNISAGTGKSVEAVAAALAKGNDGNTASLARLGLKVKDSSGRMKSMKQISKDLAKQFKGQMAGAADSVQGKIARLTNNWDEMKEGIGAKLLPVASKLSDWMLKTGMPAIQGVVDVISKAAGPALEMLSGAFDKGGGLAEYFGRIMEGISDAVAGIRETIDKNRPQMEIFMLRMKVIGIALAKVIGTTLKYAFKVLGKAIEVAITVISKLVDWTPAILQDFIKPVVLGFISMAQFIVAAADNAFGWIPGIGEKLGKARTAIDQFKEKTDKQFDEWANSLRAQGKSAGENLAEGLAKGIAKKQNLPVAQARSMATKAKQAMARELQISSPSRWAARMGEYVNEGFAQGLATNDPGSQIADSLPSVGRSVGVAGAGGGAIHIHMPQGFMVGTSREFAEYTVKQLRAYKNQGGNVSVLA